MDFKTFISDLNWFTFSLPITWEQYDDEEGTYAFFDASSSKWKGNFRISPLKYKPPTNAEKTIQLINDDLEKNKNSIISEIGDFHCVSYTNYVTQDNDEFVMYNWTLRHANISFICSFTIDKKQENTQENKIEIEKIILILKSIKLLD